MPRSTSPGASNNLEINLNLPSFPPVLVPDSSSFGDNIAMEDPHLNDSLPRARTLAAPDAQDYRHSNETGEDRISSVGNGASAPDIPVDLRLLDYVNTCDENLICPICRCPFVDPVILTECDHCFCRDCIRQTWATVPSNHYIQSANRKECPSCRTPTTMGLRSSTNKILTNILDDMVVKCPNFADGCTAQIKRGEVQDHVSLYCGLSMVECVATHCYLFSRRKDAAEGCLHFDVSCLACHGTMYFAHLESHWHGQCPDRELDCNHCRTRVSYKDLVSHRENVCPGISVPCPGKSLGCACVARRTQIEAHAQVCPLAALQPIFAAQKQRLDEQEKAQKQMSRRVKILESGISTIRDILYPSEAVGLNSRPISDEHTTGAHSRQPSVSESARFADQSDSTFDPENAFPAQPYNSPIHHLLSMHESLREEMSRITNALQESEGRQSMQMLNENMRQREEIAYLRAQQARLAHQVQWLTSVQLEQQTKSGPSAGNVGDIAAAGSRVEAAVNSAVRTLNRMANPVQERLPVRRGSSEEGRTKL